MASDPNKTAAWQPIETAPKDGTDILVACPQPNGTWVITMDDLTDAGWSIIEDGEASHWMPLPEPPQ